MQKYEGHWAVEIGETVCFGTTCYNRRALKDENNSKE